MIINTKYNLGDVRYMPRSFVRLSEEKTIIDGVEWARRVSHYEPEVKRKLVALIKIEVDKNGVHPRYLCTHDGEEGFSGWYKEEQLDRAYATESEAWAVAEDYAIHQKKEYHG